MLYNICESYCYRFVYLIVLFQVRTLQGIQITDLYLVSWYCSIDAVDVVWTVVIFLKVRPWACFLLL